MNDNDELIYELRDAVATIRELRRQNELLEARVSTMELLGQFLNARTPQRSHAVAPDVAWKLEQRIQRLEDAPQLAKKEAADT